MESLLRFTGDRNRGQRYAVSVSLADLLSYVVCEMVRLANTN